MDFNPNTVKSMGAENYCINYAVNIKENGDLYDGYKFEDNTHSVRVEKSEKDMCVYIRAYVDGLGWIKEEIVL